MEISAYLYVNRGEDYDLPYRECITSLSWCDEVIVGTDPRFDDGTINHLNKVSEFQENLRIISQKFDYNVPNPHGAIKQQLRAMCKSPWLLEMDADEILLESEIHGIIDLCVNAPPKVGAIEVPMTHLFNGNWVHKTMPTFRTLMSRNIPQIRHDVGSPNYHGRFGAALITNKGLKYAAGLQYANPSILHYGWYSLPRKWEMRQTLHYYESCLQGKCLNGLKDYTQTLDEEEVDFWGLPWILPLQHYTHAIQSEMYSEPLKRFRGKHPSVMKSWMDKQRVLNWNPSILKRIQSYLKKN